MNVTKRADARSHNRPCVAVIAVIVDRREQQMQPGNANGKCRARRSLPLDTAGNYTTMTAECAQH